jgi:hypothetical protein
MHPLAAKIADLQRRLVWRERAVAVCAILAAAVATAIALGLLDYLLRISDRGVRVILTVTLLATTAYSFYRWWYVPRRHRQLGQLAVARRLEAHFPQLGDRVASALDFLGQPEDDASAGSAELRRAVVISADHELSQLPLDSLIDRRPLKRAATYAAIAFAIVALCGLLAGNSVRTAAVRLLAPLGTTEWPRTNHLEIRQTPRRLAVGQSFDAELTDAGGSLPDDVQIQYRTTSGGRSEIQSEPMNRVGDTFIARRDDVRQSFEFRAEGGDDHSMPWTKVEVVEPPRLASLKIVTHPPAYTGLPPAAAERHFEVFAGTGLEVSGESSEPLGAARIISGDKTVVATLRADAAGHERRGFAISPEAWTATQSGKYRLELETADGIAGTVVEGNLQVVPDTPPRVSWERPQDDLMVLSIATVPIEVAVKDNLAIARVELQYTRSDQRDAIPPPIELLGGPDVIAPADAIAAQQHGESREVKFDLSLEPLALSEGTQLVLNVLASDYRPGTGQTATPRRITIVSRDQLEARLAGQQAQLAQRLGEALKLQQATHDDVHGLEIQLRDAGQLATGDRDTLSTAELNQRRVGRSLVGTPDGIAAQAESMSAALDMNGITTGDLAQQMNDLKQALGALAAGPLPTAEQELSTARKTAEAEKDPQAAKTLASSLATAGSNQDQAIAAMQKLLGELSGAADFGQLVRDLTQLREDQLAHQKQARQAIGVDTLPLELRELSRQQRATLDKTASNEEALARRYERIEQAMDRLAGAAASRDATAERLSDAVELAKQLGITNLMRQAEQDLRGNRVGQAMEGETRAVDCLQELIDNLRERSHLKPEELVSKLRKAEQELAGLRAELAKLRAQLAEAEQQADKAGPQSLTSTSKGQQQLHDRIGQLARQLQQLQAGDASKSADEAGQKLADQISGQPAKSGAAQQAAQDLARAAQQLAARRAQAEEDLAREFLRRFQGELQTMIVDQQQVVDATTELATKLRDERPGRDNAKSNQTAMTKLAAKENRVAARAHDESELLAGLRVIGLALGKAANQLNAAADLLERQQLDVATLTTEQRALAQLQQIAAALEQAKQAAAANQSTPSPPGNSGGGNQPNKRPTIELFEAKLLRSLQVDLNDRTVGLQQTMTVNVPRTDESRADAIREAEELAAEQGHLAELVRELQTRDNKSDEQGH